MEVQPSQNINQSNDIENNIYYYRLNNILVYIIIVINKIITLLKNRILRKAKILYFHEKIHYYEIVSCKDCLFEIKKDLKKDFDDGFDKKSNIDNNMLGVME